MDRACERMTADFYHRRADRRCHMHKSGIIADKKAASREYRGRFAQGGSSPKIDDLAFEDTQFLFLRAAQENDRRLEACDEECGQFPERFKRPSLSFLTRSHGKSNKRTRGRPPVEDPFRKLPIFRLEP
jgi:hypothetical protein